jgi:hypothetical protein
MNVRSMKDEVAAAWHAVGSAQEHVAQARRALSEAQGVLLFARTLVSPLAPRSPSGPVLPPPCAGPADPVA